MIATVTTGAPLGDDGGTFSRMVFFDPLAAVPGIQPGSIGCPDV
jgi:hypothetical protein